MKPILYLLLLTTAVLNFTPLTLSNTANAEEITLSPTAPKISVQLWSVREALKQDFKGTISQLADMGFQGVELAGDFGEFSDNPEGLKEFISSLGMQISGAHVNYESLSDENFDQTIHFYKTANVPMLMIPYDARAGKLDAIDQVINDLNRLSPKVEAHGIRFGYHNHDFEFANYSAEKGIPTFWDYIAQSTSDSFVLQLDVGWVNYVGLNPVDYVKKYPGRTLTTHYKATLQPTTKDKQPIIGQDTLNWGELYEANKTVGGTQWIVLEQEEYPNGLTPLQAVALSKEGLDEALKSLQAD